MDLSFDIDNAKGDRILVALSSYDNSLISAITDDPEALQLCIYDVSLVRKAGKDMVGYNVLMRVARILADFMRENDEAVLCFYCDGVTELERHHKEISPQQYRSTLFSRLFEMYVHRFNVDDMVNYPVVIVDEDPWKSQFAHFICRKNHTDVITRIRDVLVSK